MNKKDTELETSSQLRHRAEGLARMKVLPSPEAIAQLSLEETQNAIHSLHVHQIELEMQNEELQQAQLELVTARARYFDLYNLAPVGYFTLSEKGLIQEANLTAQSMLGMSLVELEQQPLTRLIHKADQDIYYLHCKDCLESGKSNSCELRMVKKDGAIFWAHMASTGGVSPGQDAKQVSWDATGSLVVLTDITERKLLEIQGDLERSMLMFQASGEPLQKVLEHILLSYETLFPGMHASISLLDEDGIHLSQQTAPNLPQAFRRAMDGMEIGPDVGSCGTAAYTRQPAMVADIAQDSRWQKLKDIALAYDLQACWAVPILGTSEQLLGAFAFYFKVPRTANPFEVETIQHGAHLASLAIERHVAEAALLQSERFSAAILDSMGAQIAVLDRNGVIVAVNKPWQRFALENGTTPGEAASHTGIGSSYLVACGDGLDASSDVTDASREGIQAVLDGRLPAFSMEYACHSPDTQRWFSMSTTPLGTECTGAVVVHTDITKRVLSEQREHDLEVQLQQNLKMESLGRMASGVAHDMNNVLGAILGLSTANLETLTPDTPVYRAFDTISKAATRGGRMVKGLLSFARQNPSDEQEVDANAILREEIQLLEHTTLSRVHLEMDLFPELRPIRGDVGALTNAFMNLCVNAVDAMPDNGTLTLRTRNVDNDWIEVQVEDNGSGMSPEVLNKAFDPFFTTKEVGKGTGLGLSMVYSTVKAHHGQMDIQSEPGRGTRVRMRFPTCEHEHEPQVPDSLPRSHPEPLSDALDVLLVDDDELIQSSIQALMEVMGHRVTTASRGEEALLKLEAGLKADVVILDMNMPGLGGVGTLPRLRAMRPTVPILLATGRADQTALDLIKAHPGVTLLSKPFGMAELRKHLDVLARPERA